MRIMTAPFLLRSFLIVVVFLPVSTMLVGCGGSQATVTTPGGAAVDKDEAAHQKEMQDYMEKHSK